MRALRPKIVVLEIEPPRKQMGTIYVTSNSDEENIAELEEFHFMTDDCREIPIVSVESSRKIGSSKSRVKRQGKNMNVFELFTSAEDDDGQDILTMSRDDGGGSNSRSRSRSGGKTLVMKTVSFDENGNVYKVYGDTPDASVSGGDDSSTTSGSNNENGDGYNEVEDINYVHKANKGYEEEKVHSENEEESPSESSKEEEAQVTKNVTHRGIIEHKREFQLQKGSLMFSPPLPLKMEP